MKDISNKVPKFKSIEEEAHFWDTHSIVDLSELTAEDFIYEDMDESLTIRLQPSVKDKLKKMAREKGIHASAMARMLLVEKMFPQGIRG